MRKARYYSRLVKAFFLRFKAVLFFGIVLGLLVFVLLSIIIPSFFNKHVERVGVTGRYHVEELPDYILRYIGEGLTSVAQDGSAAPGLASEWESQDSGKTWVFHLKDDIYWHDGTKVTSADIDYNFSDVEVSRPDEHTITFKLNNAFSPFPVVVSRPVFKKGLIGTGEWGVSSIILNGKYVEQMILKDNNNEKKIFNFYPTEDRAKLAFKLGKIDNLLDLIDPMPFDKWSNVTVSSKKYSNRYAAIFFNNSDPLFNDNKPLRQALSYAINKQDFGFDRAISPISPNSWAYNPQSKDYEYDPDHAKELIDEIPDSVLADMNIKLATTPALLNTAEKVAKYWGDVGIKTTVQVVSILPSEYQAFLAIYDVPQDPDQYVTWHSTQIESNIAKYSNPRIDKLLEDGRTTIDQTERRKIYLDFQRFLLEDAPAIFLYHPVSYTVSRK
jgi:peptide/nickel transport system substrate-binding protein